MRSLTSLFAMTVLSSSMALAQAPPCALSASLPAPSLVVGEPLNLELTFDWPTGVRLARAIVPADIEVLVQGPSGDVTLKAGFLSNGRPIIPPPEFRVPPGEKTALLVQHVADAVLCAPGEYHLRFHFSGSRLGNADPQYWQGDLLSQPVSVTLVSPQGEDARVWELFQAESGRSPADEKAERLLGCHRFHEWVANRGPYLLSAFPTSTYSGYALQSCPASFGCNSYDCFERADDALFVLCGGSIGGGQEKNAVQQCIKREHEKMLAYAKSARAFLDARPDFQNAAVIRRLYSYCLAFTGDRCAAYEQIRILSKGNGKLADEARAFLEQGTKVAPK